MRKENGKKRRKKETGNKKVKKVRVKKAQGKQKCIKIYSNVYMTLGHRSLERKFEIIHL